MTLDRHPTLHDETNPRPRPDARSEGQGDAVRPRGTNPMAKWATSPASPGERSTLPNEANAVARIDRDQTKPMGIWVLWVKIPGQSCRRGTNPMVGRGSCGDLSGRSSRRGTNPIQGRRAGETNPMARASAAGTRRHADGRRGTNPTAGTIRDSANPRVRNKPRRNEPISRGGHGVGPPDGSEVEGSRFEVGSLRTKTPQPIRRRLPRPASWRVSDSSAVRPATRTG